MSSGGGGGLPGITTIHNVIHELHENWGMHLTTAPIVTTFVVLVGLFFFVDPVQTINNFEFLLFLSPIWVPFVLAKPSATRRLDAKRYEVFSKRDWVLLELRMPRDTTKTPFAMETFISNLHIGSGEATWYKKRQGNTRPTFSLELVSLGGRVHFYIWTTDGYRNLVEAYLYAQYPGVEIIEAEDYSRLVDPASHDWDMWGGEFKKTKPNPIPIKTYMDYNLTPGAKPEENVDPIAQLVEYLGSLGPGEQFWIQFVIRMTKDEKYAPRLNSAGKPYTWRDEAADVIKSMRTKINAETHAEEDIALINMNEAPKELMKSIERNIAKQGFDVGIRSIYSAPKDKYKGINVPGMLNMFKPFNSESANSIGLQGVFGGIFGDYPWEDKGGHHAHHLNRELIDIYRQRAYFYYPYRGDWSIFSTEELATLFHIPSAGITTPNLARTQSASAAPPENLPT